MNSDLQIETSGIDWQEYQRRYGSDLQLGNEILASFFQDLTEHTNIIFAHQNNKQYQSMLDCVHKLHGAACYSCVPTLKQILHDIETTLKKMEYDQLSTLMTNLHKELKTASQQFQQYGQNKIDD